MPAIAAVAAVVAASASAVAAPSELASGAYVTDGPVRAIAHANGRTYIGGEFSRVGRRSGAGAVLSANGAPVALPPAAEIAGGEVRAAVADGSGGWYIGGTFTSVGGAPRAGLAHIDSEGTVDLGFNPNVEHVNGLPGEVNALQLSAAPSLGTGAQTLYVGGSFARAGAAVIRPRGNLAALKASDGSLVDSFAPATKCTTSFLCTPTVHSLKLVDVPVDGTTQPQPVLFVGGEFTHIGLGEDATAVDGVTAVWGVGATNTDNAPTAGNLVTETSGAHWQPDLSGTTTPMMSVHAIETSATPSAGSGNTAVMAIYLGGWAVANSTSDTTVRPFTKAFRFKLKKADRFLESGATAYTNWRAEPAAGSSGCRDCAVRALAVDAARVYFGGDFRVVGPVATNARYLAKIGAISDPDTTGFTPTEPAGAFATNIDGPVRSLSLPRHDTGALVAGGEFGQRLLVFDTATGGARGGWSLPAPDSRVSTIAIDPASPIYIGGDFRTLEAVPRRGLAAFDVAGQLLDWAPNLDAQVSPRIHALAASANTVYVGGQFGDDGSQGHANLAAIDAASGASVQSFDPDVSRIGGGADVLALSLGGSTLYVGGAFDHIGGHERHNLASVDAGTGGLLAWSPQVGGAKSEVRAILPACEGVFVGGWFDYAGGQPRQNLAALDPATGAATPWNPGTPGQVLALARFGRLLYAGGTFEVIGDQGRQKAAAIDIDSGQVTGFNAGIDASIVGASVRAISATDSAVYLGGDFLNLGGASRSNLGAVDPGSGVAQPWNPVADGRVDALVAAGGALYAGGAFTSVGAAGQRGFASFPSGAGLPFTPPGCGFSEGSQVQAAQPGGSNAAPPPAPGSPTSSPPPSVRISNIVISLTPPRTGGRTLLVRFKLSRAARVRLRFERLVRRSATRRRFVRFAEVTVHGKRGINRLAFPRQKVGRRRLVGGVYRLQVIPQPRRRGARVPRPATFVVTAGSRRAAR